MFEVMAAVGGGLFVLASLVVGGRLVWLSRRTRGLPEFVLGAGLFLMGGVGYPLMAVAINGHGLADSTRAAFVGGQMLTTLLGMGGVAWFTVRVFRPREAWALSFWLALVASYGAVGTAQLLGPGLLAFALDPQSSPWRVTNYLSIVVMSWAGIEAVRYWLMLRKRLALGLADPVVTDRFRLWAIAILTSDAISVISAGFEATGVKMIGTAAGGIVVGALGLVAAAALWLAFVPNEAYLERVRRQAAGRA